MSTQAYLIDTNIIIGLEDNHSVQPAFAALLSVAARYKVDVFVHEAARDDIAQDRDIARRQISLSKLEKFQILGKVRGLTTEMLECDFGPISRSNDIVDATLLHAVEIGAADFLVTQDHGLHARARRRSFELGHRVLFAADAVELLRTTYEPIQSPLRFVEEVSAHTIPIADEIFDSLREDYAEFDDWWRDKCIKERRHCWIVEDNGVAGLIVRKDEAPTKTDATLPAEKILKICTFKVRPEKRGFKLGELLLKKVFWFAQYNDYDLAYITTYPGQDALIDLLAYYGFENTAAKQDGELIFEKTFSRSKLERVDGEDIFETDRKNYPRFVVPSDVRAFGVPIRQGYHDVLYPDLKDDPQQDLFEAVGIGGGAKRPGNTIRKVYLCRAQSRLGPPGSLLFFYKGKSSSPPSQALTAVGILEELTIAESTRDLMRLTGGRSVYSEEELEAWKTLPNSPVKVINYLLVGYIDPPITLNELNQDGIFSGHPPQSIFEFRKDKLDLLLARIDLGFDLKRDELREAPPT